MPKGVVLIDVVILLIARNTESKILKLDKNLRNLLKPNEIYSIEKGSIGA